MSCLGSLFCVGINHKSVCPSIFNHLQFDKVALLQNLSVGKQHPVQSLMLMHTCNRIELYGTGDVDEAKRHLLAVLTSDYDVEEFFYQKTGEDAVMLMMHVASALHSKLIGDAEILGQFKKSAKEAKDASWMDGFMERLVNKCIECAKEIRTVTSLIGGQSSLPQVVAKLVSRHNSWSHPRFLLTGMGDLGQSVAQALRNSYPDAPITVANRTVDKYVDLLEKWDLATLPYDEVPDSANHYDILISAVSGQADVIRPSMLDKEQPRLIIDLSVPGFFHTGVRQLTHTQVLDLDDTSALIRQYQAAQKDSIPQAFEIVEKHFHEFISWAYFHQGKGQYIVEWSSVVGESLNTCPYLKNLEGEQKKKVSRQAVGHFAKFVKSFPDQEDNTKPELISQYLEENKRPMCKNFCQQKAQDPSACAIAKQLK